MTCEKERYVGKVAFVTGAANGIRRATTLAFRREGANVVVPDISEKDNQETARMIEQLGRRALAVKCDVTRGEYVKATLDNGRSVRVPRRRFNNAGSEQPITVTTTNLAGGRVGSDHSCEPPQRVSVHEIRDPADAPGIADIKAPQLVNANARRPYGKAIVRGFTPAPKKI
jgi:NAD(P)-dependent dehydrogenase (short-subunit alcohol dehydrogenase family)